MNISGSYSMKEAQRQQLDTLIARKTASFMSDAKWVRLLDALVTIGENIGHCQLKLIWDEELRQLRINEYTGYEFDYYAHAMEALISGTPAGWYAYREIEWIEFNTQQHNLEQIASVISAVGQFELEYTPQTLRLYAYR